jgi:hypothetical protein
VTSYLGRDVVVGTRHGKERQLAPAFAELLGARVFAPPDLDTDRFGTFAGEVPRTLAPLDAARAKARLAVDATGTPFALASEASYGPLPGSGWPGHEELLLFADLERGLEVVEVHRSLGMPGTAVTVRDAAGLGADLPPGQGFVVRVDGGPVTAKGLAPGPELERAIREAAARAASGAAVVEPDLRAHQNASRRAVLEGLARRLAARLATPCLECAGPGFGRDGAEPGLPCAACGCATELPRAERHACPGCGYCISVPLPGTADPRWCPDCNP